MIMTPTKSLRLKNKRLLSKLEFKGLAGTEPSVSDDFNGDPNVVSNPEFSSVIQATIRSAYITDESAQARQIDNLVVNELAKLVEKARLIEEKKIS